MASEAKPFALDQTETSADGKEVSDSKVAYYLKSPLSTCSTAPPMSPSESCLFKSEMSGSSLNKLSWQEDEDDEDGLPGMPVWNYHGPSLEELLKDKEMTQQHLD
eukprot:TRINITY_DN34491_c0_g1_i1.p1 TRINITY_DN34491_c0_g1~~TRINITY_DN34491_c0_g1_i1.p1  ORF type:complete len:105 (-),score=31.98 TRINITY_DN34491_c0_g1_i1:94-408(-)